MISLKKYMGYVAVEQTLRQIIRLLIQGLETYAVEGDRVDYEQFRASMAEHGARIKDDTEPNELLLIAGACLNGIKEYNERTSRFVHAQSTELQHMVSMLTHTVVSISSASDRATARLEDIGRQVERASVIEDVRTLKLQLSECLDAIRQEATQQKIESQAAITALRSDMDSTRRRIEQYGLAPDIDPVTGLPGQGTAAVALIEAAESNRPFYAVVFIADRVRLINQRFGYAVGDEMLRAVSEEIRKGVSAGDALFRWRGPSLLFLIERTESMERVRREIRRVAAVKSEKMIQLGTRSILLPISVSWALFPMCSPRVLMAKVDQFVTSQAPVE